MSDKINETIKDIAVKHGVVLVKDDPILILQTMNERLLEENRRAQLEMLAQFREEMESILSQWKDNANEKAEKILNAALISSKETMKQTIKNASNDYILAMAELVSKSQSEARDVTYRIQKFGWFTLFSSLTMLIVYFIR